MDETRTLAKWVVETGYEQLPQGLPEELRVALLDAVCAGFVGTMQPAGRAMLKLVTALGGTPEASIINQSFKIDAGRAALANGTLIGTFESEPLTGTHGAGTALPAALAIAQRDHLDGRSFITAVALGYEVSSRLSSTAVGLEEKRGFHNPGTQGPFAAAAAVGKLLHFDHATMVNAFGVAGSGAAGLLEFAWEGADTKRTHLGRASQLGLEAALLAQNGLVGPATVLEGPYGYFNAFSLPTDVSKVVAGLGERWASRPPRHKYYATHVTHQAVVHAIQEFKKEHPFDPKSLTKISILGTPRIMEGRHSVRTPSTVMGGQYSLPFTAAVAICRDMSDPLVYDDQAIADPVIRDIATRIELIENEGADKAGSFSGELTLEFGGERHVIQSKPVPGSAEMPFTWDDACAKFYRFTQRVLPKERAKSVIDAIANLHDVKDMGVIAEALAAAPVTAAS